MSAVHPSLPPDESVLEAWFGKDGFDCKLELAAGADPDHVRAQMLTLLTEAATGQYWAGRWKHVDLGAHWHVLRLTVGEDSDLEGAHLDGHHSKRVEARELVDAAREHLASQS